MEPNADQESTVEFPMESSIPTTLETMSPMESSRAELTPHEPIVVKPYGYQCSKIDPTRESCGVVL